MRLLELSITSFRGFGARTDTIRLDADIVLFYGPNGFGKTSFAEAIEWLFYGKTKRRQRGDTYSRNEYAGSYANVHGGAVTQVEALISQNGYEHKLTRRLLDNEGSETLIDGRRASFSELNVRAVDAVHPVIAQHGLQAFIHSKPKDRRDAVCAALGLDELTDFKAALESARSSFQRSAPSAVQAARRELTNNAPTLAKISATAVLAARWQKTPMQVDPAGDLKALLKASEALTGAAAASTEVALEQLRKARQEASRAVFDATPLATPENAAEHVELIRWQASELSKKLGAVADRVNAVIAAMTTSFSGVLLEFWKTGLAQAPEGDTCPMCEAPTLDDVRRAELARRLSASEAVLKGGEALAADIIVASKSIDQLLKLIGEFGVNAVEDIQQSKLRSLLADAPGVADAFLREHAVLLAARSKCLDAIGQTKAFIATLSEKMTNPSNASEINAGVAALQAKYSELLQNFIAAAETYLLAWGIFSQQLASRIATSDSVTRLDAVGKTLKRSDDVELLGRYKAALDETQDIIKHVEDRILQKQNDLLKTRGTEVKTYYTKLTGSADVGFDTMEPGTDSMKLHAVSYGARMSAAANLSECQLNCLGLAVSLMKANTPGSPFGFVLLDDPVQSMDDDHTEAFIADVVPHLVDDHSKQVVVLSHTQPIIDRLRDLNKHRLCRVYHLEAFDRNGPSVVEQVRLSMLLADIKGAIKGNERNRMYAVDRIRVLAEQFIRELHLKINGVPPPAATYDRATASLLLPLFRTIPGTTQQEHAGIKDTVEFSDPSHHTQVGYTVPVRANIEPHANRLEQLMKKYGLV